MDYVTVFFLGALAGAALLGYLWYRYHVAVSAKIANLTAAAKLIAK
jgi:hypothetical protein